jgi:hypothetical protein
VLVLEVALEEASDFADVSVFVEESELEALFSASRAFFRDSDG